jgi:hypothetical protein
VVAEFGRVVAGSLIRDNDQRSGSGMEMARRGLREQNVRAVQRRGQEQGQERDDDPRRRVVDGARDFFRRGHWKRITRPS